MAIMIMNTAVFSPIFPSHQMHEFVVQKKLIMHTRRILKHMEAALRHTKQMYESPSVFRLYIHCNVRQAALIKCSVLFTTVGASSVPHYTQ